MQPIKIKDIIFEDFTNYKKPSMFIATTKCSFKCEKEDCNVQCHNSKITLQPTKYIECQKIIDKYVNNDITSAVVIGGLEPFDTFDDLLYFVSEFRKVSTDDIVIYTGYTEDEIKNLKDNGLNCFKLLLEINRTASNKDSNVNKLIIKYGRFKASGDEIFDNILGIALASSNQYAKMYGINDVI